ncbi:hypothetical protein, partial [Enterobacter roggenkampii]|uniref:hypothetical protein n=1 Tax=Enterobacter roggenkampii TaxID=1812935 RepID=UPI002893105D
MSEFELLAQDLLEKAGKEEKLRQENDKKLIEQVLEIYDQKYVAVDSIGQRNSYVKTWGCGGFLNETNI